MNKRQLFYFISEIFCETKRFHINLQPKGYIYMRRDVFQGISDPTRREILDMISRQPLNVNSVARQFETSRTAIYKHIKVLTECGLIVVKQQGRERYCEAQLGKLSEVSNWVEQYRKFWNAKLDSLEIFLNQLQSTKKKNAKGKGIR
jgi:DNA-binding transcriptional ArsR family regulator